jgi:diguanylate cyclase (GGDEF)-like protein
MKILIVEDSRSSLLIISRFVERLGSIALLAENGARAIEIFQNESPDIVLLDVILPDMDGFAVAGQLRALEKGNGWTPIIFLSSLGKDEDIERGIAAGGDDYLLKPVSEVVLGAKIHAMQRITQMRTSLVVLTRKLDTANQELKRLSASDGLTGIANRRLFDEHLRREWRRARRSKTNLAVMMCDVDHFKQYNDTYGHQAGDDCLRQIAGTINSKMERASDIAARYGGEEFSVILPETTLAGAVVVGEKIRHAINELSIPHRASPFGRITVSIGIAASLPDTELPAELLAAADRTLYRAKHEGRNRVCRFDPQPVQ